ncbi:MAG: TatD family hydrolase, partial [Christensenellaceae bacterium]|nr:TatD family hydrolase [Christensenellaceae bacterium]
FDDIDNIISNMKLALVEKCICAGSDLETSKRIVDLTKKYYDIVYGTVGYHPHEAKHFKTDYLYNLEKWSKEKNVVCIGEIGLDYYYEHSDRETQKKVLNEQLDLAVALDVPVMFHVRDAHGDMLELLKKRRDVKKAVMHCFSGSLEIANEYIKMGYIISFAGPLTYKNSAKLPIIAKSVPLDQFFIETDSPYLSPVPYRGKINQPAYVVEVAKKIAEIKQLSLEQVAEQSFINTCNFYNI